MCIRGTCNQRIKITELRERKPSFQRAELSLAREESVCSKYPHLKRVSYVRKKIFIELIQRESIQEDIYRELYPVEK